MEGIHLSRSFSTLGAPGLTPQGVSRLLQETPGDASLGSQPVQGGPTFREVLSRALEAVNQAQAAADAAGLQVAAGEGVELHEVMIAAEQAALALELTLALQRKFVEAYQEISRMQI